jgi:hypothetical protein
MKHKNPGRKALRERKFGTGPHRHCLTNDAGTQTLHMTKGYRRHTKRGGHVGYEFISCFLHRCGLRFNDAVDFGIALKLNGLA